MFTFVFHCKFHKIIGIGAFHAINGVYTTSVLANCIVLYDAYIKMEWNKIHNEFFCRLPAGKKLGLPPAMVRIYKFKGL